MIVMRESSITCSSSSDWEEKTRVSSCAFTFLLLSYVLFFLLYTLDGLSVYSKFKNSDHGKLAVDPPSAEALLVVVPVKNGDLQASLLPNLELFLSRDILIGVWLSRLPPPTKTTTIRCLPFLIFLRIFFLLVVERVKEREFFF